MKKSTWQQAARDALAEMEHLKKGWNSYSADPPTAEARAYAQEVVGLLSEQNLQPDNVVPSAIGGVGFNFTAGGNYAAIEIDNDGLVLVSTLTDKDETDGWEEEFSPEALHTAIKKLKRFLLTTPPESASS